jgi:hypothetical protein
MKASDVTCKNMVCAEGTKQKLTPEFRLCASATCTSVECCIDDEDDDNGEGEKQTATVDDDAAPAGDDGMMMIILGGAGALLLLCAVVICILRKRFSRRKKATMDRKRMSVAMTNMHQSTSSDASDDSGTEDSSVHSMKGGVYSQSAMSKARDSMAPSKAAFRAPSGPPPLNGLGASSSGCGGGGGTSYGFDS